MSSPRVTAVAAGSPAAQAGVAEGDELVAVEGTHPRDVIEFHQLTDGEAVRLTLRRPGTDAEQPVTVVKAAGEPLGLQVASAVFDRVRTCDNHCAFCFIYQLPKGMRRSLYLKDDDYRLSFLYGNFTTLTRFTELDAERVLTERLGPLFVSIHATDPEVRAGMLRNPKGATSLRWLKVLLEGGIEVHGQVVVCPGVNDGPVLEDTLAGILDEYDGLATAGVVPLGVSRHSAEPGLRPHTRAEAEDTIERVHRWQEVYRSVLGHRLVYAADEYYLLAGQPFPALAAYEGLAQHENGIGMARAFEAAFGGDTGHALGVRPGFFAAVDGAPAAGYRAPRAPAGPPGHGPVTVLTGAYGAQVLGPLVAAAAPRAEVVAVENRFFGGNISVAGLLTGPDLARVLAGRPEDGRYLLPDACLSEGRFLDGSTPADLPRAVEVVPSDGASLRTALGGAGR
jgi:putative radical SAM enzyme (TIGR03279 family)